jgi:5-carboxymethyl-2-hydroxymuconate isomerase
LFFVNLIVLFINLNYIQMPHFIIDCSENVIRLKSADEIMQEVFNAALSTDLFTESEIKVRINPFSYYNNGNSLDDFIHVFGYIMEGRNTDQKAQLSKAIVTTLNKILPEVPVISINIKDFEKASYFNKTMI